MRTAITGVIGAALGVAIGYAMYVVTRTEPASFVFWVSRPGLAAVDWIVWAVIGAGVAVELRYLNTH